MRILIRGYRYRDNDTGIKIRIQTRDTLSLGYDGLSPSLKAKSYDGLSRRQNITAWIEAIGYRGVEKRLVVRAEPGLTFSESVVV